MNTKISRLGWLSISLFLLSVIVFGQSRKQVVVKRKANISKTPPTGQLGIRIDTLTLDQLEGLLLAYIQSNYLISGRNVSLNDQVTDTVLVDYFISFRQQIEQRTQKKDQPISLVDEIEQIPLSEVDSDFENSSLYIELRANIESVEPSWNQVEAWLAFAHHFAEKLPTGGKYDSIVISIANRQDNLARARCYLAIGNHYCTENPGFALNKYLIAYDLAVNAHDALSVAFIERKIADMFWFANETTFKTLAERHYNTATSIYLNQHDTDEAINSMLDAAGILIRDSPDASYQDKHTAVLYCNYALSRRYRPDDLMAATLLSKASKVIGDYFSNQGTYVDTLNYNYAIEFYKLSLLNAYAIKDYDEKISLVSYALYAISWVESRRGNLNVALRNIDNAISLTTLAENQYSASFYRINKVEILYFLQKHTEAKRTFESIYYGVRPKLRDSDKTQLDRRIFHIGALLYRDLGFEDSARYFENELLSMRAAKTDVLRQITDEENSYKAFVFQRTLSQEKAIVDSLHETIIVVGDSLKTAEGLLSNSRRKVDSLANLKTAISDSLTVIKDSLASKKGQLVTATKQKAQALKERAAAEGRTDLIIKGTVVGTISASALVTLLFVGFSKRKRLEIERLVERRKLLQWAAKSKLHDVPNNFMSLENMLAEQHYLKALGYVNRTVRYLQSVCNSLDSPDWSLLNELTMTFQFYESEQFIRCPVEIDCRFHEVDIAKVKFPQDCFPALLHNSMKYGFADKPANAKVWMHFSRTENELACVFIDNGKSSAKENYLSEDRPNDALYILRERVRSRRKLAQLKFDTSHYAIDTEQGTSITFVIPYEEI